MTRCPNWASGRLATLPILAVSVFDVLFRQASGDFVLPNNVVTMIAMPILIPFAAVRADWTRMLVLLGMLFLGVVLPMRVAVLFHFTGDLGRHPLWLHVLGGAVQLLGFGAYVALWLYDRPSWRATPRPPGGRVKGG